jgi:hypothetical protein
MVFHRRNAPISYRDLYFSVNDEQCHSSQLCSIPDIHNSQQIMILTIRQESKFNRFQKRQILIPELTEPFESLIFRFNL